MTDRVFTQPGPKGDICYRKSNDDQKREERRHIEDPVKFADYENLFVRLKD